MLSVMSKGRRPAYALRISLLGFQAATSGVLFLSGIKLIFLIAISMVQYFWSLIGALFISEQGLHRVRTSLSYYIVVLVCGMHTGQECRRS